MTSRTPQKLISFDSLMPSWLPQRLNKALVGSVESLIGASTINNLYGAADPLALQGDFFTTALHQLDIKYQVPELDMASIPKSGPLVVVANHPFGAIEGVILGDLLTKHRPDVKILGNYLLSLIPELRPYVISIDPFEGSHNEQSNGSALRQCVNWLKEGGCLITFPAGEVSHSHWKNINYEDPAWSPHMAAIIKRGKATSLPIYFPGRNSTAFNMAGFIHPRLRTALLVRELNNKRGKTVQCYVGNPIPYKKLVSQGKTREMTSYLRKKTYFLKHRLAKKSEPAIAPSGHDSSSLYAIPVAPPVDTRLLKENIEVLKRTQCLLEQDDMAVYHGTYHQLPHIMQEIGRLREATFRLAKEGTGKAVDLDRFDRHYEHVFLWHKHDKQIMGAYRLGHVSRILKKFGSDGLYTSTLFKYKPEFLKHADDYIEMGRSFISQDYQVSHKALATLWRGIGQYLLNTGQCRYVFGPVSISKDYLNVSKTMIVNYLKRNNYDQDLSKYVDPRSPYRTRHKDDKVYRQIQDTIKSVDDISLMISELESDKKGIPVLLRHYLKLNATLVSFNVDKDFADVLDGLIVVDLCNISRAMSRLIFGRDGEAAFKAGFNGLNTASTVSAQPK